MPTSKVPSIKVAIRSPREDQNGSHPIVEYNMPVIAPGEKLPPHKGFNMPKEIDDLLNKNPEEDKKNSKKKYRVKPKPKPKQKKKK
jgi:hypothetical protein